MTRVFISGPISDQPNLNREAFHSEEALLRMGGFETFNPHSIIGPNAETLAEWRLSVNCEETYQRKIWQYYMRICVGQIPLCDEMRMLPHWQNSKGSVWEHKIASMLGLKITYCPVVEATKW